MYNVVRTRELDLAGVNSRTIRQALGCCLIRLHYGIYSVIKRCTNQLHVRIATFINDREWIEEFQKARLRQNGRDFSFEMRFEKLRISAYPDYRSDDVIVGSSAATLHDLPLYPNPPRRIFVSHPTGRTTTKAIHRTSKAIPARFTEQVGKLVVASQPLAAVQLIKQLGAALAFPALERALRRSVFGSDEAADNAARFGYPNNVNQLSQHAVETIFLPILDLQFGSVSKLTRLLDQVGPLSESYAESRCAYNFFILGLIGVKQQCEIFDGNQRLARVDFLHRETKTIIFVDGVGKYSQHGFELMRKESDQHHRLLALGYRIVRISFAEVLDLEGFATKLFNQAPEMRNFQGQI